MLRTPRLAVAALAALALAVSGSSVASSSPDRVTDPAAQASRTSSSVVSSAAASVGGPPVTRVLAVSIDGLRSSAVTQLGRAGTPTLHRLMSRGASTLNARTEREMTVTLPNHTGMVTGRRITASQGGHGVTWNDDRLRPRTVQRAAGHDVSSVFRVVHNAGRRTAAFASKTKFSLFERSWDGAIDKFRIRLDNAGLVRMVRNDLLGADRGFTFLHLSAPDSAGHASGWGSPAYLDAVRASDRRLGQLVRTIEATPRLSEHLVLMVTADHGGSGKDHSAPTRLVNYRIPFIVWGPTVAHRQSLYRLNADYANPGQRRTSYSDAQQPVRNGMVANLALDLLGLPAVKGSEHDRRQNLDWN
jgi:predicted AlkP superfamily pyrophosphatase or phosphodiesterase